MLDQFAESKWLERAIRSNLKGLGYGGYPRTFVRFYPSSSNLSRFVISTTNEEKFESNHLQRT